MRCLRGNLVTFTLLVALSSTLSAVGSVRVATSSDASALATVHSISIPTTVSSRREFPLPSSLAASGPNSVAYTLDLVNNTLLPGNFPTLSCATGEAILAVTALGKLFLPCSNSNSLLVVNLSTGSPEANIAIQGPGDLTYDPQDGAIYVTSGASLAELNATNYDIERETSLGAYADQMVWDGSNGCLYVSDLLYDSVWVVSGATDSLLANVSVDHRPSDLVFDARNGDIYVLESDYSGLSVISGQSNRVVATIFLGSSVMHFPSSLGFDPSTGDIYVGIANSNEVDIIAWSTNTVFDVLQGVEEPDCIVGDAGLDTIYVAGDRFVYVVNASSNVVVGSIPTPVGASACDAGAGEVFLVDDNGLVRINEVGNALTVEPPLYLPPWGVIDDSGSNSLYLTNPFIDALYVVSGETDTVTRTIPLGDYPQALCYDNANGDLFVAVEPNSPIGEVNLTVVSAKSGDVLATYPIGQDLGVKAMACDPQTGDVFVGYTSGCICDVGVSEFSSVNGTFFQRFPSMLYVPQDVVYDPRNGDVYVTGSSNLTVINGSTSTISREVAIGSYSTMVGVDSLTGDVYVADPLTQNLTVLSDTNFTILANLTMGSSPDAIACDNAGGEVYVANSGSGNLTVINGSSVVGTVLVGTAPVDLAYDAENSYLYVAPGEGSALTLVATTNGTPTLTGVSVTTGNLTVPIEGKMFLTARPACEPDTCPPSSTYSWSVTDSLGVLHSTAGPTASISVGATPGTLSVFVNVTLGGKTVEGALTGVHFVPTLNSVDILPASPTVNGGAEQSFTAVTNCTGGPCPQGISFFWGIDNGGGRTDGSATDSVSISVDNCSEEFTLVVYATLGGLTIRSALDTVSVTSAPACGDWAPWLIGNLPFLGVVAVLAVAGVVLFQHGRKPTRGNTSKSSPTPQEEEKLVVKTRPPSMPKEPE